jgi:hypothetical protein
MSDIRIFKAKWFVRFACKQKISDEALCRAVYDAEDGKIDADLGAGVIKQRIARPHEGKSGGYRTIIYYRRGNRAFFVFGFSKKDRENLSINEEQIHKKAAGNVLGLSEEQLKELIQLGTYTEVICHAKE